MPLNFNLDMISPEQMPQKLSTSLHSQTPQTLTYRSPSKRSYGAIDLVVIDDSDSDAITKDLRMEGRSKAQLKHLTKPNGHQQSPSQPLQPVNAAQGSKSNSLAPGKRPRGRPRKYGPTPEPPPRRPRGRPRKHPLPEPVLSTPNRGISRDESASATPDEGLRPYLSATTDQEYMRKHANTTFIRQLRKLHPPVTIRNEVDESPPPTNFAFISEYEFGPGTGRIDPAARYGCKCRKDNGRNLGCEYLECGCLEDAARDDDGSLLGFPYHAVNEDKGCLRPLFLNRRDVIYECNELCNCPSWCKNKVVQNGRQVPLEIFKTERRGWGVRCPKDLRKGQFVEVYIGEVITDAEADRREKESSVNKDSYLFSLDKFFQDGALVVDGELKGSPARFINHSCDPNLRIFAVSLVRGDPFVYELAFFAAEDIPAGTELTFDYLDKDDEEEEEEVVQALSQTNDQEKIQDGKTKCRCGAPKCRRWLWI